MFIPLEYTGVKNNFLADIGLIVVQNSFTLSRSVQPVCVDWVLAYDDVSLHNVKNITGWVRKYNMLFRLNIIYAFDRCR
jgi:hypothetical protein